MPEQSNESQYELAIVGLASGKSFNCQKTAAAD
jgi:hypothetical protein